MDPRRRRGIHSAGPRSGFRAGFESAAESSIFKNGSDVANSLKWKMLCTAMTKTKMTMMILKKLC